MSRSVEQALLSLMPSHGSALPPQLVELAGSLLAQSRHRASALKAEEEIARVYACCHIACDRLKIALDLPPIDSRPPIPPRIYKRLYAHLDNTLPKTASSTPRDPGRGRSAQNTPTSSRGPPSRVTPSKETSLAQFRLDRGTPTKSTGKAAVPVVAEGLPPWVQPTIRFMCRETKQSWLAPSMLAGAEYIIAPGGRRTKDEWVCSNLAALCGALYYFVVQQVRKLQTGEEINRDNYLPVRKQIRRLLGQAREDVHVRGLPQEEFWGGYELVKAKDIDAAVEEMTDRGWPDADWFRGLSDVVGQSSHGVEDAEDAAQGGTEPGLATTMVRGADSMLQEKYDYFTDEKRRDYRVWKEDILRRIDQLERTAPEDMEVDT